MKDSLKEYNIVTADVPPFGLREMYRNDLLSRHTSAARCHACKCLYDPHDTNGSCPRCCAKWDRDRDEIPIHGLSMWCECCGKIMCAFWQDMETSCGSCGAVYVNNGSGFLLKSPGAIEKG